MTFSGARARRRPTGSAMAYRVVHYLLLAAVVVVMVVPLFWLLTSALKPSSEIYRWPIQWLPTTAHWQNFVDAWNAAPFARFFLNSIINMVVSAGVKVVFALMCAYAFTFLRLPLKNVLFFVLLGAMMVPGHVTLLSNYLTVSSFGWVNTYAGLIVPGLGSVFGTFLLRQHMLSIPRDIVEAAKIDGAGHVRTMLRVVAPISKPVLITIAIVIAIEEWNSFIWPLIVTNTTEMRTLPVGLQALRDAEGLNDWGSIMAGTTMVALPVLIVFFVASKYIIGGITQGAIKG